MRNEPYEAKHLRWVLGRMAEEIARAQQELDEGKAPILAGLEVMGQTAHRTAEELFHARLYDITEDVA